MRRIALGLVLAALAGASAAQVPGGPVTPYVDPAKAYLFARMTREQYGVLYYSVRLNGPNWTRLNGGRPVSADYHGHASIARGGDGRCYPFGNKGDDDPAIRFWVSDDLVRWTPFGTYSPELKNVPGRPRAVQRIGAPKLFYDTPSHRFLLTWHAPNLDGSRAGSERYWGSRRTLYLQSPDLKTFAAPPR